MYFNEITILLTLRKLTWCVAWWELISIHFLSFLISCRLTGGLLEPVPACIQLYPTTLSTGWQSISRTHTHTHAISLFHLTFVFLDCRRAYYVSLWVPMLCFPVFQVYKVSPVFYGQLLKDIFKGTLLSPLLLFSSIHTLMFSLNWEAPNPHASI